MIFEDFFQSSTGTSPYGFQSAFAEPPRLPDLLEAPTGSGKTATACSGLVVEKAARDSGSAAGGRTPTGVLLADAHARRADGARGSNMA